MATAPTELSQAAKAICAQCARELGVQAHELIYTDISSQFGWLPSGELIWARRADFRSIVFWVDAGHEPVILNRDSKLERLTGFLSRVTGGLPGSLDAEAFASALRKLGVEPRGFVASPGFLERIRPFMDAWTRGPDPDLRAAFESHCAAPVLQVGEQGWRLEFRYFNPWGGVERWEVVGGRDRVHELRVTRLMPDGTFRFPYR